MKHILMIAPRSIPVYGAEEIVNLKLLKALSNSGQFKIDLISRRNKTVDYPYDAHDVESVRLNSNHIVEVDNRVTPQVALQHLNALAKFGCVFRGAHWAAECVPIAENLVRNNNYDYVITKSESSFLLGYYLKKKFGVKWVATWNDPYPFYKCPPPYGSGPKSRSLFDGRIMSMLRTADIHVFPNERLRNYVRTYIDIVDSKTRIVPHVVIRDEIMSHDSHQLSDTLRLISSGNIRAPRDPKPFLRALQRLVSATPNIKISFSLLGLTDDTLPQYVSGLGLDNFVKFLKPVPYGDSIKALSDYDVAVIFEAPCEEGIFLPTKVSDYMQSGVNIFAVSPSIGVLNDLYRESKIGYFADATDENAIFIELKKLYDDFAAHRLFTPAIAEEYLDNNVIDKYLNF